MDLTSFTSQKSSQNTIIKNNEDVFIQYKNGEYYIEFKTKKGLKEYENHILFAPTTSLITQSTQEANTFFEQALQENTEGVMTKSLNATYVSGLRTGNMAKVKELKEDLDVVVVAAEYGRGKRTGYYSSFYISVYNPEAQDSQEEFPIVGKVASGMKELDDQGVSMKNLTQLLEPYTTKKSNTIVYFEPKVILQVRYQEIQPSNIYSSGYALRFPRIILLRDDKPIDEINTIVDIENLISK